MKWQFSRYWTVTTMKDSDPWEMGVESEVSPRIVPAYCLERCSQVTVQGGEVRHSHSKVKELQVQRRGGSQNLQGKRLESRAVDREVSI